MADDDEKNSWWRSNKTKTKHHHQPKQIQTYTKTLAHLCTHIYTFAGIHLGKYTVNFRGYGYGFSKTKIKENKHLVRELLNKRAEWEGERVRVPSSVFNRDGIFMNVCG